jgi:hypothetical protein
MGELVHHSLETNVLRESEGRFLLPKMGALQ